MDSNTTRAGDFFSVQISIIDEIYRVFIKNLKYKRNILYFCQKFKV